jgi:hypothetical protein
MTDFSKYAATTTPASGKTDFSKYGSAVTQPATTQKPSSSQNLLQYVWGSISEQAQGGLKQIQQSGEDNGGGLNPIKGIEAGLQAGSGIASIVTSPLAPIFKPVGDVIGNVIQKSGEGYAKSPLVQKFAQSPAGEVTERVVKNISNATNIAGAVAGFKGGAGATPKVASVTTELYKTLTTRSEQQIESAILKKFEKGVKPTLAGKNTPAKLARYRDDVVTGVKTITQNKGNLTFIDDTGEAITGQTPKSIQQLSEGLEQTKRAVFQQYDSLAKEAGEAGVKIPVQPIVSEIDTVIKNPALRLTNPRAVRHAQDFKDRLLETGDLDASITQDVVQNLNNSLKAYYRNPNYETASQASIDAMIANQLRKQLDAKISGLTGESYQALKNQYAALKAIENDVVKAALREARKSVKGLIDFTDIFSGGQVVSGILSLNPGQIGAGLTQKAISEFYKYLNDPNRAIEKMFDAANELPVNAIK